MAGACLIAFMSYTLLFVLLQQFIGHRRHASNVRRGDPPAHHILMLVWPLLLLLSAFTLRHEPFHPVAMAIGGTIVVLGLFISMWAQSVLGRFWVGGVGLHKQHQLITAGPYRYVRHPLYSGMLVSAVGFGIFSLNIVFFLMALSFAGAYTIRIYAEEGMLRAKFKQRYERYAATTGMMFPRVRRRS